jgi:hypothetical protein
VLEGEGRRRDHDPIVTQQARHEVGQRLAGARAGLDEQVLTRGHRIRDGLGHLDLARPFLTAQRRDGGREHVADGGRVGHRSTLTAVVDSAAT